MGVPSTGASTSCSTWSGSTPRARKRASRNYSLGMRQRLGIAHALLGDPDRADPRRAGQRPRPGGHPLDARAAARASPTAAAPSCCPATCSTRSSRSPTRLIIGNGRDRRPAAPARSCWPAPARSSRPPTPRRSPPRCAPPTCIRRAPTSAFVVDADPEAVGAPRSLAASRSPTSRRPRAPGSSSSSSTSPVARRTVCHAGTDSWRCPMTAAPLAAPLPRAPTRAPASAG